MKKNRKTTSSAKVAQKMPWTDDVNDRLARTPVCGYSLGTSPASEPTALTAIALLGADRDEAALPALNWLVERQLPDGSIPVRADQSSPGWTTSLAILAWRSFGLRGDTQTRFARPLNQAIRWLLSTRGEPTEPSPALKHDTTLIGWSWVQGTHSWVEPTALAVLALKSVGQSQHPRTREAVRLLNDRQIVTGGCNYGNTEVLGQTLRPHVQSTGIAMLSVAGEAAPAESVVRSLDYLERAAVTTTASASLAWALLGLASNSRLIPTAHLRLAVAVERTLNHGASPHRLALLALAAQGVGCPLVTLAQGSAAA